MHDVSPGRDKLLSVLFSHIEQTLNPDKDQSQQSHTDARPPRTQGAIELQDGDDGAVDQYPKQGADYISYSTR
jgi:hypothetical protein